MPSLLSLRRKKKKKRCRFVTPESDFRHLVPPDTSTISPELSQQVAHADSSEVSTLSTISPDTESSSVLDHDCSLPQFEPLSNPVFTWGSVDADTFCHSLEATYSEIVHWRNNSFKIPSGNIGKKFVLELAWLFRSAGEGSNLESIALKAAFTFCTLVTQKPTHNSKSKDHISCLERRVALWRDGNLNDLVLEGRTIQYRLKTSNHHNSNSLSQTFAKLMFSGKTAAAMQLLSSAPGKGGVLHLDDTIPGSGKVYDILKSKHPVAAPLHSEALLSDDAASTPVHPVIFDALDGPVIKAAALRTSGAAGPSGIDAHGWRRLCSSFCSASEELCSSIAILARRLCTTFIDPEMISSLMACRLIALDKRPGVRPIGIGETVRRIIAKAVLSVISNDIQHAAGSLQLCAGQPSGGEAAVHSMREVFNNDDTEGMLLIDATNAFNSLNRAVALHNIQRLCPAFSTILVNTYRHPASLFVDGDVQGDPLAMPFYALATVPLIQKLTARVTQVWYADDAAACVVCGGIKCPLWGPNLVIFQMLLKPGLLQRHSSALLARIFFVILLSMLQLMAGLILVLRLAPPSMCNHLLPKRLTIGFLKLIIYLLLLPPNLMLLMHVSLMDCLAVGCTQRVQFLTHLQVSSHLKKKY